MAKESGETRTLAVQIPAELADRIDEYLEQEMKRKGYKLTKKDFIIGLVEKALNEAEEALRSESQTVEDGVSGTPIEPEDDDGGTPAEPEDDDGEAPTEPEAETSEDPDEDSQQEDGETGGDDDEVQTAENA